MQRRGTANVIQYIIRIQIQGKEKMSKSQQQKCTHKILLNQQTAQKKLQTHLLELIYCRCTWSDISKNFAIIKSVLTLYIMLIHIGSAFLEKGDVSTL